jgi:hypothetical protein
VNPPQPPEPLARVVDNALDLRIGLDRHTLQRCITRQVTPSPAASSCLTWLKTRTPRNPATLSAAMSSVWNPDVAESVGIASLADNVVDELARDVDFRLAQVLEEAMKFMRHGKRTTLTTKDISNALKVLNVEPLYGYESTRPLRFGEASLGPGQPLYYVEDEEVTFTGTYRAHAPFGIPAINF